MQEVRQMLEQIYGKILDSGSMVQECIEKVDESGQEPSEDFLDSFSWVMSSVSDLKKLGDDINEIFEYLYENYQEEMKKVF